MVKGRTRRVIVVKPTDKLFEEAIFIVRDTEDAPGVTGDEVIKEAQQAARQFLRSNLGTRRKSIFGAAFWIGVGAAAASLIWYGLMVFLIL